MTQHEKDQSSKGTWLTYRPEIKIVDCTIRDGGLINSHMFEDGFVRSIYEALRDSGVDYMEMGYKGAKSIYVPTEHGPWKHCDEELLRRIVGDNDSSLKITVMADAERTDYHTDILPKEQSVIDMIRVATYIHQIPAALDMLKDAKDKGYETTLNLMAISIVQDRELDEALAILADSPADVIYIVDSFGFFYSEQIRDLVNVYSKAFAGKGKQLGIHAHNNQQLAYANTIESLIHGVNYLDSTINGMGRGAGNCPTELLLGFLKNPKYKLRPILQCIQNVMMPLQKDMEWGYQLPYMFTGQLNLHPREAIKMRASDKKDDYVGFYDQLMEQE